MGLMSTTCKTSENNDDTLYKSKKCLNKFRCYGFDCYIEHETYNEIKYIDEK